MNRRLLLYLMAAGTVGFWGASFPLTKAALDYLGPTSAAFVRWTISAAVLAIWLARAKKVSMMSQLVHHHAWTVIWVALTGITLFYFLENLALRYTTAVNAGVLSNLTSVFMVLIGTLWLRERLAPAEWGAMLAAFAGAVLVSQGSGHLTIAGPGLLGDGLMVVAGFFGAVYSIGGKGLVARYPADVVTTVVAAFGSLFLLPLALLEVADRGGFIAGLLALPWQIWAILLVLGLGSGALANLWWMQILARMDASRAALIIFLVPVVSTVLSVTALGEPLTATIVFGALLVLAGVVVVQRHR